MDNTLRRGLNYLCSQQLPNGSFNSYSSPAAMPFQAQFCYQTTFGPALILDCLQAVDHYLAQHISRPLAAHLLEQKSSSWSFNYWTRDSSQNISFPLPDDLDDTFCSLNALRAYDSQIIKEEAQACLVKILLHSEQKPGGPYRTWLVKPGSSPVWGDIDLAVNCIIFRCLTKMGQSLPELQTYIKEHISSNTITSSYYPPEVVLYLTALAYRGSVGDKLQEMVRQTLETASEPLIMALMMIVLDSCLPANQALIKVTRQKLLDLQAANGSWAAAAFCYDPSRVGQRYYSGSRALTTAFVLQALNGKRLPRNVCKSANQQPTRADIVAHQTIISNVKSTLYALPEPTYRQVSQLIKRLSTTDNWQEITLLPRQLQEDLQTKRTAQSTRFCRQLGQASLHGWLAYTIYDHHVDGLSSTNELPPAELLPVANIAQRRSLRYYRQALDTPLYKRIIQQAFTTMDLANCWELTYCRFKLSHDNIVIKQIPDYHDGHQLADRSLGHSLSGLAVMIHFGLKEQSLRQFQTGFEHYLIGRQLLDDLHDWQTDLQNGHISYVVAYLFTRKSYPAGEHNLTEVLADLRATFWEEGLVELCEVLGLHLSLARQHFSAIPELQSDNCLIRLVARLEEITSKTIKNHQQAQKFLYYYQQPLDIPLLTARSD